MNLLANMFGGGITGYLTNNIAIKLLFKKIGPFEGMILKRKDQFIKDTSALVERDIINHRTIENELQREEFKGVFADIIADILQSSLYENTVENMAWIDIPGMGNSIEGFIDFYNQNRQEFTGMIMEPLLKNVAVENLLSKDQIDNLAAQIFTGSMTTLEDDNILENLLIDIYYENHNKQISKFISPEIIRKLADNLKDTTSDFHIRLKKQFEKDIDKTIAELDNELEITEILKEAEESFKTKTLAELLGRENTGNIANELLQRTVNFLQSAEGQKLLLGFIEDLIDFLKKIDIPILELFAGSIRSDFEDFLNDELPYLVNEGLLWVKDNKREIEKLIEDSADEILDSSSGIKNKTKKALKNIFYKNFTADFEVVEKIVAGIEKNTEAEQMRKWSQEITDEIIKYINNNSTGDIIQYLEDKNILKATGLLRLINKNIDGVSEQIDLRSFDGLFATRLDTIIDINLQEYFDSTVKDILISRFKEEFLFNKRLTSVVQRELTSRVIETGSMELSELISEDFINTNSGKNAENILQMVNADRENIKNKLVEGINNFVEGKNFSDLLTAEIIENMINGLAENSQYYLEDIINNFKYREISDLYDHLNEKREIVDNLTDFILELITTNLSRILEGNIENAVADNLKKLPDQQLQKIVEDFMGNELQPIIQLGAGLGVGAGVLLFFLQGSLGVLPPGLEIFISLFVYGFIGWLTNVIAIKMIFQPYEEKRFMGIKIPLTPGVVAKNKERFVSSLGNFIDKELLNSDKVDKIFKDKIDDVKFSLKNTIAADNYKSVSSILEENSDFIAGKVFALILNHLDNNQKQISIKMTDSLANFSLANQDLSSVESGLKRKGKDTLQESDHILSEKLNGLLDSNRTIDDILPPSLKSGLYRQIDKLVENRIRETRDYISDDDKVQELVKEYSGEFAEIIELKISDLISGRQKERLSTAATEFLAGKIKSGEIKNTLLDVLEEKFLQELSPDRRIGNLFDGKLLKAVHDNTDFLLDSLFEYGVDRLQAERKEVKQFVTDRIKEEFAREKNEGNIVEKIGVEIKQFGYNALDAEQTVREIIDDLVDNRLPAFLERKRDEIKNIANSFLTQLEGKSVADTGIDLSRAGVEDIIDRLVNNQTLINNTSSLIEKVLYSTMEVKLKSLLKIVSIEDICAVFEVFAEEICIIRCSLSDKIYRKDEQIKEKVSHLINKIFTQLVLTLPLNRLSLGIEEEEVNRSVQRIIDTLQQSEAFNSSLDIFIGDTVRELQSKNMKQLLNIQYLQRDMSATLRNLRANEEALEESLESIKSITGVVVENINLIVDKPTKDYVLDIIVDSLTDSLAPYFLDLINSVNIQDVTQQEINKMEPEEIEDLFYSFAGSYLARLKILGWMGSGFGIIAVLGSG